MNEFIQSLPGIVMMRASKCRNHCLIVPNPFKSIDSDAIDDIRKEAKRNATAAVDAAAEVAGAEASAVVAGEVAVTTEATVTVDAAAAATMSAGEAAAVIVGQ